MSARTIFYVTLLLTAAILMPSCRLIERSMKRSRAWYAEVPR